MHDAERDRRGTGRGHAQVLGASIAGLLAARVLADHFERVTVLERDTLTTAGYRPGAPQARHIHALMHGGSRVMAELFPGLLEEMRALGVPHTAWLERSRWYLGGTPMRAPQRTDLTLATPSRPLLESMLRTRVTARPNVSLRQGCQVIGLVHETGRVTGVRVVDTRSAAAEVLTADLVVDTTGRNSKTGEWLATLGYRRPAESRVAVDLGYCSRRYRRRPGDLGGDLALTASTVPGMPGAAVLAIEDDTWHVTLSGTLGRRAPTDPQGFQEYAAGVPIPDVIELIRDAEALDDPVQHRVPDSIRRRYEDLADPPEGLIVLGDAVTSFNPIYAQGMTVAAQEAQVLASMLAAPGPLRPKRFYRRISRVIDAAWGMSTAIDLRSPQVAGERTRLGTLFGKYLKHVQMATAVDPYVTGRLLAVINLTERPRTLLRPGVFLRVAALSAPRRRSSRPPAAPSAPEARPGSAIEVGNLVVRRRIDESEGVISLALARPDGRPLPPWTPGAHIDVHVGAGRVRQYSLCGDPAAGAEWRIAVLREPQGRGGSAYLHDEVTAGTTLTVGGLRNNFPLTDAAHTLLIAGGIGITPLLPMIRELQAAQRSWSLHYGGRSTAAMAFAGELSDDPRCTLHPQGQVGLLPLAAILDECPEGTAVYCCGPEGLLAAVERLCLDRPGLTLRVERFQPRPPGSAEQVPERPYEVELRRSGITLTVDPGKPLIDAVRAAGVTVPSSCREGVCASCETPVLAGQVVHRDSVLTAEERAADNTMMLCVSAAASSRLVLDL